MDSAADDDESENAMLVSNMIRGFFTTRDCSTLVRPVVDEKKLQNLSSEPFETLRPEFQEQITALRESVFKKHTSENLEGFERFVQILRHCAARQSYQRGFCSSRYTMLGSV